MNDFAARGIRGYFSSAKRHLCDARAFVFLAVAVFMLGILAGFLFPDSFGGLLSSFRAMAEGFRGRSTPVLILMIFMKNFTALFLSMWAGAVLGIFPFFSALTNGLLLGVLFSMFAETGLAGMIWGLAPHGVFELPATFTAWGLGFWRGAWLFRRDRSQPFRDRAGKAYRVFFAFVLPLLIIAAVVEGLSISAATSP
jgi:stage II sporulation protein M